MSQATSKKVMIIYNSPNTGKHPVRGMATKEYYGYRRRGDQFMVSESDIRMRPDLFRPVAPIESTPSVPARRPSHRGRPQEMANVLGAKAVSESVQPAPPPPPPVEIEAESDEPDPYELPPPLEMKTVKYDQGDNIHNVVLDQPLETLKWDGKVNKRHLSILAKNDITTLADLIPLTEDNVLSIKGIGEGVTRALFSKLKENNF